MRRCMLKSKIHRATLTSADLHYEGSLTLDAELMAAADMLEYEQIQVVNVNNGERMITYLISGAAGSGVVQLNGAAARLGMPGDLLIIMTFAELDLDELPGFAPTVVHVDDQNRIVTP